MNVGAMDYWNALFHISKNNFGVKIHYKQCSKFIWCGKMVNMTEMTGVMISDVFTFLLQREGALALYH